MARVFTAVLPTWTAERFRSEKRRARGDAAGSLARDVTRPRVEGPARVVVGWAAFRSVVAEPELRPDLVSSSSVSRSTVTATADYRIARITNDRSIGQRRMRPPRRW